MVFTRSRVTIQGAVARLRISALGENLKIFKVDHLIDKASVIEKKTLKD